jgi:hypothetical protein
MSAVPHPPFPNPDSQILKLIVNNAIGAMQTGEVDAEGAILHAAVHAWYEGCCCVGGSSAGAGWSDASSPCPSPAPRSGFTGFRFLPDVIMVAVRWYLRYTLSYRDVEELLAERGIAVAPTVVAVLTERLRHHPDWTATTDLGAGRNS